MDFLANNNSHERDSHITFDEGPHIYTIDGDSSFTSVTTFIHTNFSHFDSNSVINGILKSKKYKTDSSYKYYNMTKEDILEMWDNKCATAATAGTKLHYDIECYYNNCPRENNSIEYTYFTEFIKDFPLKPPLSVGTVLQQ